MNKQCPVCVWNKSYRHWGRHMVKVHNWRYYDGVNAEPPTPAGEKEETS